MMLTDKLQVSGLGLNIDGDMVLLQAKQGSRSTLNAPPPIATPDSFVCTLFRGTHTRFLTMHQHPTCPEPDPGGFSTWSSLPPRSLRELGGAESGPGTQSDAVGEAVGGLTNGCRDQLRHDDGVRWNRNPCCHAGEQGRKRQQHCQCWGLGRRRRWWWAAGGRRCC